MPTPRILVFAGSIRTGSMNARLAALAAKELALGGAEVTLISLADYPLPLYDGDLEAQSGPPENAIRLKQLLSTHQGVFIVSPEYNASVTPLLKNTIDWISRVRYAREPALAAFRNRVFALGAASDGGYGGMRSLMALRQVLELGCGALVLPEQIALARAGSAFDDLGNLTDEQNSARLKSVLTRLNEMARQLT
jgi:chromate reductase